MPGESTSLRLFVACELPDEVRQSLGRLQDELRQAGAGRLRWVRPEGIHITLKFLGAVEEPRVPAITEALHAAIEPFELSIRPEGLGGFGGRRLRVVWVGLEGDKEGLRALADKVEGALAPLRFDRERRPLAAHLTLARVPDEASSDERARLGALVSGHKPGALPSLTLTEVALMRSLLGPSGARYERLASFPQT